MKKLVAMICALTLLCCLFSFSALADGGRYCVSCGRAIGTDSAYYPYCGAAQGLTCPNCGFTTTDTKARSHY